MKNFVYEKMVESKSWNMDSFFKGFKKQLDLSKMDEKDSIATEIRQKITKIQSEIFECTFGNELLEM